MTSLEAINQSWQLFSPLQSFSTPKDLLTDGAYGIKQAVKFTVSFISQTLKQTKRSK